jgi:hypothetical protein
LVISFSLPEQLFAFKFGEASKAEKSEKRLVELHFETVFFNQLRYKENQKAPRLLF